MSLACLCVCMFVYVPLLSINIRIDAVLCAMACACCLLLVLVCVRKGRGVSDVFVRSARARVCSRLLASARVYLLSRVCLFVHEVCVVLRCFEGSCRRDLLECEGIDHLVRQHRFTGFVLVLHLEYCAFVRMPFFMRTHSLRLSLFALS